MKNRGGGTQLLLARSRRSALYPANCSDVGAQHAAPLLGNTLNHKGLLLSSRGLSPKKRRLQNEVYDRIRIQPEQNGPRDGNPQYHVDANRE